MNKYTSLLSFIFGIILTVFVFLSWRSCNKKDDAALVNQDYYLITNQIQKMNKMVVLEQDFSSFQTHKSSAATVAGFDILPREMVLYTTAKAQVSYDLKKMKIDVDTVNKKVIIDELPQPEIKIFPDVKIHFMDYYAVNRFKQSDINGIGLDIRLGTERGRASRKDFRAGLKLCVRLDTDDDFPLFHRVSLSYQAQRPLRVSTRIGQR